LLSALLALHVPDAAAVMRPGAVRVITGNVTDPRQSGAIVTGRVQLSQGVERHVRGNRQQGGLSDSGTARVVVVSINSLAWVDVPAGGTGSCVLALWGREF
jgi:N-methylhydantoinase B/oxoprolinase/acetone carboxylase alpha subunit